MTDPLWVWPGADDLPERAGQCFTLAMEAILANYRSWGQRMSLVHGLLMPDRAEAAVNWQEKNPDLPLPPPNPHAWVEITAADGLLVLDPVARSYHPIEEHRRLYGAEVIRAYRADVAVSIAARRDNYGPWDHRTLTAWEERQRAAREDPRFSQGAAIARWFG